MSITAIAIKRPLLLIVLFTILIYFGVTSYLSLNYNLLPGFSIPEVSVSILYPGASAAEVETSVTKKLEDAFSSIEGLESLHSTSREGDAGIKLIFKSGTDIDKAERDVQRKADQVMDDLPEAAGRPQVNKINMQEAPVIKAAVTADMAPRDLYNLMDKQLRPILRNVTGVGQVDIIGGEEREIRINVNQDRLMAYGLSIGQVTSAIANANLSFPAGSIETRDQQLSIRFDANIRSLDQLRELVVFQHPAQGAVYLMDVAEVADLSSDILTINHSNGIPSVGLQVIKQSDANAVSVSKMVKEVFSDMESQYRENGVKFDLSSDVSVYTLSAADAVMYDLMLAVIIVGIVMLAFLHSLRSSLFVLVALPASIIPTFIAIYLLGFSLNLMTLMALSLVVGILVDDSIVVLENIYRHMEKGIDKRTASLVGRDEIGFTALSITLVDVVVFLPLALSGGMIGGLLQEFSLVVVFSTLMSLFVSFTITPLLASRFGRLEHLRSNTLWGSARLRFERFLESLKNEYGRLLEKVLHKKRWLLLLTTLLIGGSVALVPAGFIGADFMPETDQGDFILTMELEATSTLYRTNMSVQEAEKIILQQPEVQKVFSSVGFASGNVSGSDSNANIAELTVTLVDKEERERSAEELGNAIQQQLSTAIPGVKFSTGSISPTGEADSAPIEIAIKGVDMKKVRAVAQDYLKGVTRVPGTQFVKLSVKDQAPEIEVKLDRGKMSLLGLDATQVGAILQNSFSGNDESLFKEEGNEFDIMVRQSGYNRADIKDVRNLPFVNSDGNTILLSQFAQVSETLGETTLQRIDRLSAITVQAGVTGRPTGTVSDEIKAQAKAIKLPPGISVEYLGETKNQGDAFGNLILALITAFVLVYLIMVALYENAVYPFVVLFSIPVALVGALLALALTMESINIFTIIGMIMLLGLVSKNAILIVDFANKLKAEGNSAEKALLEACRERLRPILMTTLSMIFGMLPIALAGGAASEMKNGMAWVIIGGLTSSMLLTLFVVPCVYMIVDNLISFAKQKKTI
ncbi:efflux RND transporter permease subunit [Flavobacterium sp. MFBS3-15]|uniref:efflux RND transporter permease subunit n=1 Tax=Flavobacterium sp. MFBS3-15 TaxID=2989816 RepID=UPI0022359C6C|nr:efflux RND transporter permease subunit [Flavobacterium sp. MFBS3-15]MCW4467617.1 efflux RND transporter permease subunit [Flavobacterium sp. MFBS3-15]